MEQITKTHPLTHLRRLEKKYGTLLLTFLRYGYGKDGEYQENRTENMVNVLSNVVTEKWLQEQFEKLEPRQSFGLLDTMGNPRIGKMFLPMIDFQGEDKPTLPRGLMDWIGYGPFYRTDHSWHAYGEQLFSISRREEYIAALLSSGVPVDVKWVRHCMIQGYSVLRWSKHADFPVEA